MSIPVLPPSVFYPLLVVLATSFTLAPSAQPQVPNDDCSGAIPLTTGSDTITYAGATVRGLL